jgi:hypothetical protein
MTAVTNHTTKFAIRRKRKIFALIYRQDYILLKFILPTQFCKGG